MPVSKQGNKSMTIIEEEDEYDESSLMNNPL
jgi:hypothetical protein